MLESMSSDDRLLGELHSILGAVTSLSESTSCVEDALQGLARDVAAVEKMIGIPEVADQDDDCSLLGIVNRIKAAVARISATLQGTYR